MLVMVALLIVIVVMLVAVALLIVIVVMLVAVTLLVVIVVMLVAVALLIVIVVMLVAVALLVVIVVMLVMVVMLLLKRLDSILNSIAMLDSRENILAVKIIPWSYNDDGVWILLSEKSYAIGNLMFLCAAGVRKHDS